MAVASPQELLDFSGKVVAVTGAGSGIGTRIARRFAQADAAAGGASWVPALALPDT